MQADYTNCKGATRANTPHDSLNIAFKRATRPQGAQFEMGLVFWPGGLEADWGNTTGGLQPCNPDHMANLVCI